MTFEHLKSIYRDFDIRGKFPEEITPEEVYKIGKAIVHMFGTKKVAIGRDIRPSADELFEALARGITEMGAEVVDIGLCTTPMSYFVCGSTDVDATVMITASHMPSDYNGLKITIEDAKPVTGDFLKQMRDIVGTHTFSEEVVHGSVTTHAFQKDWIAQFKQKHDLGDSQFTIVIDPANMIGVLEIDTFKAFDKNLTVHTIFDTFDHTCPNHEANPIKHETLVELGKEVTAKQAHMGIAFDGDADRVGFVDEYGVPVPSDLIGALLARYVLTQYPGGVVVSDMRSTRALEVEVARLGGTVVREKVGHTHIRNRMRREDAVLGIELAGHFFFKDSFFSEGGPLPVFMILELMKREGKSLSQLVSEVRKFHHSGEINSTVTRTPSEIYNDLERAFPDATRDYTDGLTLTSDNWWCNVRPSANDPVMRLNLESESRGVMKKNLSVALDIIRS
jgi:phosphomannomutase